MEKNKSSNKNLKTLPDNPSQEQILDILNYRDMYCPKCQESIGQFDEIWNCNSCYSSFHLYCLNVKETKIGKMNIFKWSCEECQDNYSQNVKPFYNCFCGNYEDNKKFNKDFNDSIFPHSCGCQCGFLIDKNIKCNLICHRGPHKYIEDLDKHPIFNKSSTQRLNEDKKKTIDHNRNKILDEYFNFDKKEDNFIRKNNKIINLKGKIHVYGPKCDLVKDVIYCGRRNYLGGWQLDQSIWANPFKVKEFGTNEDACSKYEEYLRNNKKLLDELPKLVGKNLACWCYPNSCHTEIILKMMKEKNLI